MRRKIDYSPLCEKVREYGINKFFADTGIGGTGSFIYRLESGRPISLKSLDACCKWFDCDIWDLIREVIYAED